MRSLVLVALVAACGRGHEPAAADEAVSGARSVADARTAARDEAAGALAGGGARGDAGPPSAAGEAIGDDSPAAVMDELVHALARDDAPAAVVAVLGTSERATGEQIVIRPRPPWLTRATVATRMGGEEVVEVGLELVEPVAAQALVDMLRLSPPSVGPEVTQAFVATFVGGAVEVRMGGGNAAGGVTRVALRWAHDPYGHGRRPPDSWRIVVGVLTDTVRRQAPDVIGASLGIRPRSPMKFDESVSPRPPWLAGAEVRQEGPRGAPRTIIELALVDAIDAGQLADRLELDPVPARAGLFAPREWSLAAMEGELAVAIEPGRPGDRVRQRLRITWAPFARPRVPPTPAAVAATPWCQLVRELERRLERGDDADSIGAWLRTADDPPSGAWLARIDLARADSAPRIVDKVTLEVTPPIAVSDVVAAFGHYDEWTPIHFREEPEDLVFDPMVGVRGQLGVRVMIEEPGTQPPQGTVRRFELSWTPAKPRRAAR